MKPSYIVINNKCTAIVFKKNTIVTWFNDGDRSVVFYNHALSRQDIEQMTGSFDTPNTADWPDKAKNQLKATHRKQGKKVTP